MRTSSAPVRRFLAKTEHHTWKGSFAPKHLPAALRISTISTATLFGPLLEERTPGRDASDDLGGKP